MSSDTSGPESLPTVAATVADAYNASTPASNAAAAAPEQGEITLPPDVTNMLDALRESGKLLARIENFEKLLDRAERELEEERKALDENNISFDDYLRNVYIMYLKWLAEETSASLETANALNFCVARHMNQPPLPLHLHLPLPRRRLRRRCSQPQQRSSRLRARRCSMLSRGRLDSVTTTSFGDLSGASTD